MGIIRLKRDEFQKYCKEVSEHCQNLGIYLSWMSNAFDGVNVWWKGKRCNAYLKIWNESYNDIKRLVDIVSLNLPKYLAIVGSSFAKTEGWDSVVNISELDYHIPMIKTTEYTPEMEIFIDTKRAEQFKKNVYKYLDDAMNELNLIFGLINRTAESWESVTQDEFVSSFIAAAHPFKKDLVKLQKGLDKYIAESITLYDQNNNNKYNPN